MSHGVVSRILGTVLLGVLFGSYIHHDYSNWRQRGREEFLSHQSARFDRFICSPKPIVLTMFGALIAAFGIIGFYEVTVLLFSSVLRKTGFGPEDRSSQNTSSGLSP
jgi:hypothetical protein